MAKVASLSAGLAARISRTLTPRVLVSSVHHSDLKDRLYITNWNAAEEPRRSDASLEWVFRILSSVWCVHTVIGHYVTIGHLIELIPDKGAKMNISFVKEVVVRMGKVDPGT